MKERQRFCSAILALFLLLSFTACGKTVKPLPTEGAERTVVAVLTLVPEEPQSVGGKELLYTASFESELESGEGVLRWGEESVSLGFLEWSRRSFVAVMNDGSAVVYATIGFMNDWFETVPVILSESGMKDYPTVFGTVTAPEDITGPEKCVISTRESVFGTYGVRIPCTLGEDGLIPDSDYMEIINRVQEPEGSFLNGLDEDSYTRQIFDAYGQRILTLKRGLTLHTETGDVGLPAASVIRPVGLDLTAMRFYVETENGNRGWLCFSESDKGWGYAVDGIDEEELFETIPYAG